METAVLTAIIAAASAVSGVLATSGVNAWTSTHTEKRRIKHDLAVRQADRERASADRRRSFEIENLQAAYDAMGLLARESALQHAQDMKIAKTTKYGYGGAYVPDDPAEKAAKEDGLKSRRQAAKAIRLILDDRVRSVALEAQSAMSATALLSIGRQRPVSAEEGEASHATAVVLVDAAMDAIAQRLREAIKETPE